MRFLSVLILTLVLSFSGFAQSNKNSKPLAEDFTAIAVDGKNFTLSELRGKVVLVTFWSPKCLICAAEIPKLNQLAASYAGKDVVFLGLTVDNESNVKNHIKKKPFNFNLLPNAFGVLLKYADKDGDGKISFGYPAHFLVNQAGEIEIKASGFNKTEMLDKKIAQLLKTK